MRATGIVRRIDELGRVVIPKEIRKTLRIKEGDPLEIYTEREELLLKKYSPIANFDKEAETVAQSLSEITDKICIITDCDQVLSVSHNKLKEYLTKEITDELTKIIIDRKSVLNIPKESGKTIKLLKGDEVEWGGQIIVPVISSGDAIGSVILLTKKDGIEISAEDMRLVNLGAIMIGKIFE